MKAALSRGTRKICIEDIPQPQIGEGDVLVKVYAAAVCGTDRRIYNFGHARLREGELRVLGHEICGVVEKTGKKVKLFKEGDRVVVGSNIGCGNCDLCRQGLYNLCSVYDAIGLTLDGGFAQKVLVPETAINQGGLLHFPDSIKLEQGALIEPFACVYNGFEQIDFTVGEDVVIIGSGPIGIMTFMLFSSAGAGKVILANRSRERLEIASKLGVKYTVDTSTDDLKKAVMELTEGRGADIVITACPSREVAEQAIDLLTTRGRLNFFGGLPKEDAFIKISPNKIHYDEIRVLGTHGSNNLQLSKCIQLVKKGVVDLSALITHRYQLEKIEEAINQKDKRALKQVIFPNGLSE